jgi:hypothetical protein
MDDSSQAKCLQSWAKCDSPVCYTILPLAGMSWCSGCDKTQVPALPHFRGPLYLDTNRLLRPIKKSLHPERKSQLGGLRRRWKDNIKIDLKEIGC